MRQAAAVVRQRSGITARHVTFTSAVLWCTQSMLALTAGVTRWSAMCVDVCRVTAMSLLHICHTEITVAWHCLGTSLCLITVTWHCLGTSLCLITVLLHDYGCLTLCCLKWNSIFSAVFIVRHWKPFADSFMDKYSVHFVMCYRRMTMSGWAWIMRMRMLILDADVKELEGEMKQRWEI